MSVGVGERKFTGVGGLSNSSSTSLISTLPGDWKILGDGLLGDQEAKEYNYYAVNHNYSVNFF